MHLGHEAVPDLSVEASADGGFEELCRRGGVEAADPCLGQVGEHALALGIPYGEDHRDGLGEQSPGHEPQCLQGHLVEPLGVVDQDEHGSVLRRPGEQGQHGQSDQEAVRKVSGGRPERHAQCVALWGGQFVDLGEERCAQLVEARVGQLHVRFDALGPGDRHVRRAGCRVFQQYGLPHAGLSAEDPYAGLTGAWSGQEFVEHRAFPVPADQVGKLTGVHGTRLLSGGTGAVRVCACACTGPFARLTGTGRTL